MGAWSIQQLVTTFHIGRSGSTVLGDLLNQHPAIEWLGEIYEWPEFRESPAAPGTGSELLRRLRTRLPAVEKPVVGIEAKFYHLHDHGVALGEFLEELRGEIAVDGQRTGRCRFVVLRRKNYLRKIVSSLVARQRGQWFARSDAPLPPLRLAINPERVCIDGDAQPLLDYLRDWDAQFDQLDAALAGEDVLQLTYEDDIEQDPLVAYGKVCRHLGLAPGVPEIRYNRTTPQALADIVTTLDAIRKALEGSGYEWMTE
ncbi:MAG: hypothetical protein ABIX37_01725 [Gammaproteobacteria bacterium]